MRQIQRRNQSASTQKFQLGAVPLIRKEEMESHVHDNKVLRVYCDASTYQNEGIYGLGVAIIGGGTTVIKSKKHYSKQVGNSALAEILCVLFAFDTLYGHVRLLEEKPEKVIIFTDSNVVANTVRNGSKKNREFDKIAKAINFSMGYLGVRTELILTGSEKKQNPYYKAAHNASRKIIGK